jgi:hypothetical protein
LLHDELLKKAKSVPIHVFLLPEFKKFLSLFKILFILNPNWYDNQETGEISPMGHKIMTFITYYQGSYFLLWHH